MKKTFITLLSIAAVVLSACQPRELVENAPSGIREVAVTLSADLPETRTFIEAASNGWQPKWDEADSIYVTLASNLSKAFKFTNGSGAGVTGSFSGSIEAEDGTETIYAFHPKKSNRNENIFKFVTGPDQKLPALTTFDPEADVLVSDALQVSVSGNKAEAAGNLHFHRILAVSKVVVADASTGGKLSGKKIKSITLKSSSATLSGEVRVDITTAAIDGWESKSQQNYVKAEYSGDDCTADGTTGAFVILNPTTLPAGSTLTLSVETDDESILVSRTATLSADITLEPNVVNTFKFNITDSDIIDATQLGETLTWDFSSSDWQTEFKKYGSNDTWMENFSMTFDGLSIVASKGKFRTDCFQMSLAGSSSDCYFKFNASGSGLLTVWATNTGSSTAAGRSVTVLSGGTESSIEAGVPSNSTKAECKFNVSAGDVYVYCTGGALRIYKLEFTAGASGGSEGGNDNPGGSDDPAQSAELECTNPPQTATVDPTVLYGFAAGVTGGEGASSANVLHFDNGKALQTWLLARAKSEKKGDKSPVIIWLSGTFGPEDGRDFSAAHPWFDVKEVSNLSFYGTEVFVMDRIGMFCVRASNIIIRNINFQQPKANNGADAVSMQDSDGVWVDHCTFTSLNQTKDYEDGSTDITHGSKNVTVSWCHYVKTQKSCLVGHSNSQSGDVAITATFHHNWFDQSSSRHPRVRYGVAHVYNNLFDGCTTYGVGSAYGAKVLVEYN